MLRCLEKRWNENVTIFDRNGPIFESYYQLWTWHCTLNKTRGRSDFSLSSYNCKGKWTVYIGGTIDMKSLKTKHGKVKWFIDI